MPVFISYSHQDKEFVDHLAHALVENNAHIWLDRWELDVGDSLLERVQNAIQEATALIVVLSCASVASEWCKKELNAGLFRELDEKRVVVLPALIDNCERPMFLKDKLYADFRSNFDEGLQAILKAVARVSADDMGRISQPGSFCDWSLDWGYQGDLFRLRVTIVEHGPKLPNCVLTEINILANEPATERYKAYEEMDLDWFGRFIIINFLVELDRAGSMQVPLQGSFPVEKNYVLADSKSPKAFTVEIRSRRLGNDTGNDLLLNISGQLANIRESLKSRTRKLTADETRRVATFLAANP